MSRVFDVLAVVGYVLFVGFMGWSALNPACRSNGMFGVVWCVVRAAGVLGWSAFAAHAASCLFQPGLS